jgi:hypothetical protein
MMPRFHHHRLQPLLALVIVLLWTGCSTSYDVKVDSISKADKLPEVAAAPAKEPQSYVIENKNPSVDPDSLRYKEAAQYVKTALSGKGFYEASSPATAEMVVEVDFGIDAPKTKMEQTSVPVYAQTGGGVRYKQIAVQGAGGGTSFRTIPVYDAPQAELIGYEDVIMPVTVYEKYLRVSARENKEISEGKVPAEIWSVHVSTEDESKDLRKYLPLLASASVGYIGKDSNTEQTIKLKESDPEVSFIKKGM